MITHIEINLELFLVSRNKVNTENGKSSVSPVKCFYFWPEKKNYWVRLKLLKTFIGLFADKDYMWSGAWRFKAVV